MGRHQPGPREPDLLTGAQEGGREGGSGLGVQSRTPASALLGIALTSFPGAQGQQWWWKGAVFPASRGCLSRSLCPLHQTYPLAWSLEEPGGRVCLPKHLPERSHLSLTKLLHPTPKAASGWHGKVQMGREQSHQRPGSSNRYTGRKSRRLMGSGET